MENVEILSHDVVAPNLLPPQYYIICDEAVSSTETVLSPYSGRNIGLWRDSFNYHLSAMRQCIERAFGMLTRRFGIFWRPLFCDFARWSTVVQVCAKLHNFCLSFNVSSSNIPVYEEDFHINDTAEVFANEYSAENLGDMPENGNTCSLRRLQITEIFKHKGWTRQFLVS